MATLSIYDEVYSSPNFGYPKGASGRRGYQITGICLHITGASWQSNYNWIMNPAANASYNAVIREDGTVISLVAEQNAAYSHGRINKPTWPLLKAGTNPNLHTLSLARTGSNQNYWTEEQLVSTLKVLRYWGSKYKIPLKRPHLFGHFEIDSEDRWYCPGEAFFRRVLVELEKLGLSERSSVPLQGVAATTDIDEPVIWHRVVAGSYRRRENADRQAARLRASGIDAFVVPYSIE